MATRNPRNSRKPNVVRAKAGVGELGHPVLGKLDPSLTTGRPSNGGNPQKGRGTAVAPKAPSVTPDGPVSVAVAVAKSSNVQHGSGAVVSGTPRTQRKVNVPLDAKVVNALLPEGHNLDVPTPD